MKKFLIVVNVLVFLFLGFQVVNAQDQQATNTALQERAQRIEQICKQYENAGKPCPYKVGEQADISTREENQVKGQRIDENGYQVEPPVFKSN